MTADLLALLDQLDEARAAATPGPWTAATAPAEGSDETAAEYLVGALRPEEGRPLWVAWAAKVDGLHGDDMAYVVPVVTGDGPASEANARYLAAVHDALPELTAALRAVLELIDPEAGMATGNGYDATRLFDERDIRRALATAALTPEAVRVR